MAKNRCLEVESKGSGSKRKKLSSDEKDVCVDVKTESKEKKKRKKTEIEEAQLQIPEISIKATKKQEKQKKLKNKQTTKKTKKKKEKQLEIAEPPTHPAVTQEQQEQQEGDEALSPEEQRVLERKLKKIRKKEERMKLKAEGKAEEKTKGLPVAPRQALDYLTCWAENRKEWRFQKTRQTWLLQHMFDPEKVSDENFSVLLSYLEGLRGAARETTIQKAEALVNEMGEDIDAQQRVHRAREVVQLFS
ncbi:protein cholesin isoform 1-T2 [Polymixia lowei]